MAAFFFGLFSTQGKHRIKRNKTAFIIMEMEVSPTEGRASALRRGRGAVNLGRGVVKESPDCLQNN